MSDYDNETNGSKSTEEKVNDGFLLRIGTYAFVALSITALLLLLFYWANFGTISPEPDAWGQFGDYLGGLLNPAVGLVTIYLVLVNVRLQRKELRSSLNEMKASNEALAKQNRALEFQGFQQTFFTWLKSYQDIVSSAAWGDQHGRNSLHQAIQTLLNPYGVVYELNQSKHGDSFELDVLAPGFAPNREVTDYLTASIRQQWNGLYSELTHHLGSMFRTLYRLLVWIDEQPEDLLSAEKKFQYVSIVRA